MNTLSHSNSPPAQGGLQPKVTPAYLHPPSFRKKDAGRKNLALINHKHAIKNDFSVLSPIETPANVRMLVD